MYWLKWWAMDNKIHLSCCINGFPVANINTELITFSPHLERQKGDFWKTGYQWDFFKTFMNLCMINGFHCKTNINGICEFNQWFTKKLWKKGFFLFRWRMGTKLLLKTDVNFSSQTKIRSNHIKQLTVMLRIIRSSGVSYSEHFWVLFKIILRRKNVLDND